MRNYHFLLFNEVCLVVCSWISLEPHCKGSDWLWAASCQGDGVFGPEEVCAQRSRCTQLHVSFQDMQRI